jgi:hypothetical protein
MRRILLKGIRLSLVLSVFLLAASCGSDKPQVEGNPGDIARPNDDPDLERYRNAILGKTLLTFGMRGEDGSLFQFPNDCNSDDEFIFHGNYHFSVDPKEPCFGRDPNEKFQAEWLIRRVGKDIILHILPDFAEYAFKAYDPKERTIDFLDLKMDSKMHVVFKIK